MIEIRLKRTSERRVKPKKLPFDKSRRLFNDLIRFVSHDVGLSVQILRLYEIFTCRSSIFIGTDDS